MTHIAVMTPNPEECCFFYGHSSGEYKWMSNFHPAKFCMTHECIGKPDDNFTYVTSEHAIMHIKARLMGDEETSDKILSADKPSVAKKLGRKVKPWYEDKWISTVEVIAYSVLMNKFTQNDGLARKLKDTKNKILAEANPRDKIWGIGLGVVQAKQGAKWNGRNILGEALMKVRAEM